MIQRTSNPKDILFRDMGVNHCSLKIAVAKQFLDGSYVIAFFEKMGSKTVS
jgi:hypothetical protein